MQSWNSYPKIYALGHWMVKDLFTVPVIVEEKIDGSQFSFGKDEDGNLLIRSKGVEMNIDAPEKMFSKAAKTVKELAPLLHPGWTYRGEYLQKPKHNALAYNRVPAKNIILFDVTVGLEEYLSPYDKSCEADRLGLEFVPVLASGDITANELRALLENESILGGQKIEGVVIKPFDYNLFDPDKKVLMGKYVSEAFKEVHRAEWKQSNPAGDDILTILANEYTTPARWQKGVMHLAERGQLDSSPRDIGPLVKEVQADVEAECAEEIKEKLYRWAWPHIRRRVTNGLPEWYKDQLLQKQF